MNAQPYATSTEQKKVSPEEAAAVKNEATAKQDLATEQQKDTYETYSPDKSQGTSSRGQGDFEWVG